MQEVEIAGKVVGGLNPVYVIAEAGINHNGSEELARKMINAAARNGADAIKFQSFRAEHLVSPTACALLQVRGFTSQTLFEFFRSVELSPDAFRRLKMHADSLGLTFLSTPFDEEMADILEELGVPAFKIASGDLTHYPLLGHVARKGRPILLSTGMSYLTEVGQSVRFLQENGAPPLVLLHCVSAYPASPCELNLRAIAKLQQAFQVPAGFSDHSADPFFGIAAAAAGASVIERHFTLDREMPGPDQALSMEPDDLKRLVETLRLLESALGNGDKQPTSGEMENRKLSRRSIVARRQADAGEIIERDMLCLRRPGHGIPPTHLEALVGKTLAHSLVAGKALDWSDVAPPRRACPASGTMAPKSSS